MILQTLFAKMPKVLGVLPPNAEAVALSLTELDCCPRCILRYLKVRSAYLWMSVGSIPRSNLKAFLAPNSNPSSPHLTFDHQHQSLDQHHHHSSINQLHSPNQISQTALQSNSANDAQLLHSFPSSSSSTSPSSSSSSSSSSSGHQNPSINQSCKGKIL